MKKVLDINRSKYAILGFSVIVFAIMLVFNCMTPYLADDYVYRYSFADAKLMTSITQIPESMYHHSTYMNGRVISHGFEQMFMITPKIIFNIVNSLMFVLCIYLMYRICMPKGKHNLCVYALLIMAVWYFTPAFGQVFLWQVGAVNYLWGIFFSMVFLYPYAESYKTKIPMMQNNIVFVLYCAFAVVLGMYSEVASFISIMIATGIIVIGKAVYRQKITVKSVLPIAFAVIGFVLLLMMPVEISAKVSDGLSAAVLVDNFVNCTKLLEEFLLVPLIIWAVLFVIRLYIKRSYKNLLLSLVLAVCALCANYVVIIASYVPERSLFMAAVLIVMASFVLVPDILKTGYSAAVSALGVALCVMFVFSFVYGAYDIYNCYGAFCEREEYIIEQREKGETDLVVPIVHPKTMHSPFWGVVDLNCESTQQWPNVTVAWYYEINSILGYE